MCLQELAQCYVREVLGLYEGGTTAHAISVGRLFVVEWQVLGRWLSIVLELQIWFVCDRLLRKR